MQQKHDRANDLELAQEEESKDVDLEAQGIDREQAQTLEASLATFSEDWNSPEMSNYDNYNAAKTIGSNYD